MANLEKYLFIIFFVSILQQVCLLFQIVVESNFISNCGRVSTKSSYRVDDVDGCIQLVQPSTSCLCRTISLVVEEVKDATGPTIMEVKLVREALGRHSYNGVNS